MEKNEVGKTFEKEIRKDEVGKKRKKE